MRARTNISLKHRYTATLSDFKGVDLNTSPLRVAQSRASNMKNFICDNGVNHKRPGWEEQFRIVEGGQALAIHGMFPYDEGNTEILLVHAGTGIYRAEKGERKWAYGRLDDGTLGITEERSQCFYRGGKAFIVGCGNYLVYGNFDGAYALKQVADIAYVPTTTIGIGGSDAQSSLDAVNLLTRWRKNTLVGSDITAFGRNYFTSYLDGTVDNSHKVTVEVKDSLVWLSSGVLGSAPQFFRLESFESEAAYKMWCADNGIIAGAWNKIWLYLTEATTIVYGVNDSTFYDVGKVAGECFDKQIHLKFGAQPVMPGAANITVTFWAVNEDGFDEGKIQNCRFGSTFGVGGADDRLFLSGNGNYRNVDFWSEYNDFTYFPDGNTMEVGASHAAITAYARLSDTTLAVLKEEKAGEPTIFYRTGQERTEADGITLTQWFPVEAGIVGDGTVNPHAVATLAGDVLTLTKCGVHALVLSSNVASGERYTRERSLPIYRELASAKLSTAAVIVYRNRYYLALPGAGKCYVADAHYKAMFEGSTDYNYEWWVWENVHAACFAEWNDQLLFGTSDGLVCAFTEGVFSDRTHTDLLDGDILPDDKGGVIYSERVVPTLGDRVVLEGNVYARLAADVSVADGLCMVTEKEIKGLWEGQEVYADTVGGSGLITDTIYKIGEIDVVECSFILLNKSGDRVFPSSGGFRLLENVNGRELYIASINEDGDEKQDFVVARGYYYDDEGERVWNKLHLTRYNGEEAEWMGRYIHTTPVCAEWMTPVMDFGTNVQSKTLLGITVATEPGVGGRVTFGYETRRIRDSIAAIRGVSLTELREKSFVAKGSEASFSFDGLDFNSFTFDTSFACSYTKRMNLRNFNFIVFRFGSETEQDCAVSGVTLKYKINQNNRGVR